MILLFMVIIADTMISVIVDDDVVVVPEVVLILCVPGRLLNDDLPSFSSHPADDVYGPFRL